MWRQFSPAGRLGLCRTDHNEGRRIFRAGLCSEGGRRSRRAAYSGNPEALRAYNLRYSRSNARLYGGRHSEKYTYCESAGKCKTAKEDMEYILSEVVQVVESINL